jgi:MOSC domain-containing protein YiiM
LKRLFITKTRKHEVATSQQHNREADRFDSRMKLISLNTGRPREVDVHGQIVRTSIWKSPREGRVRVTTLNIEGDEQSDLSVHGGTYKAVYCYPSEHYEYWRRELPRAELPWGVFGENLTTEGLLETDVYIGDRMEIGSAEFLAHHSERT